MPERGLPGLQLSPKPEDIPKQFLVADAFLILAITLSAQEVLLAYLYGSSSAILALDLQEDYIIGNEERILAMLPKTDFFLPGAEVVQQLSGLDNWANAARYFASLGPSLVVIKLGENGCLVYGGEQDKTASLPAFPASNALDGTGAGDSFCGGFDAALDKNRTNALEAAMAASVSASFAIANYGVDALFTASSEMARQRLASWHASAS